MTLRAPDINCDPLAGSVCLPGTPRRTTGPTAIDLFAGAGGFTVGAEKAGAQVVWAINHFREAVATHALNHPHTTHCCESVYRYDWRNAPLSDLILASPSCKCHSQAATGGLKRGRRHTAPHNDELRAHPEAVIAAVHRAYYDSPGAGRKQPIVVIENVPEFRDNYVLYEPQVLGSLTRLGYAVSEQVIEALDLGVPSRRKRLFIIAVPGRTPFDLRMPKRKKRGTLGQVIDKTPPSSQPWVPLKDYPSQGVIKKAKEQTGRIKTKLGRKVPEYWAWTYTNRTNPIMPDQPFRTVTAKIGGQTYVMRTRGKKNWIRMITPNELKGLMGFPKSYKLPASPSLAGQLVGNAVAPPVSELIVKQLIERA